MALVVDPNTGRLVDEKELGKSKDQKDNKKDINQNLYKQTFDETELETPEQNNEVSGATAFAAGLGSGVIKTVEGVVSLGAELLDLGADTNTAAQVEAFFDKINPLEELAEQRAIGRLTEALVQVGIPGAAGARLATTLATKALKAKKAGKLVSFKNPNIAKGKKKAEDLNKLSGTQRFGAVVLGGAAGETLVADVERIGNISDLFGKDAALALDRDVRDDPSEDASRKLMNRVKFGAESVLITPFVYGTGVAAKALAKRGKELAYSSGLLNRGLDKFAAAFRFRGTKPLEVAEAKKTQKSREMRDVNFAEEQVARIDRQVDKVFPDFRKFFNASSAEERKKFLTLLDDGLFKGDLNKIQLDKNLKKQIDTEIIKRLGKKEGTQVAAEISNALTKTRGEFANLLNITAGGPGGKVDLPAGVAVDLRKIMGNRVKNYIGNTFEIFENAEAGFLQKYKPTRQSVEAAKKLFMRYAAKNDNPITDLEAEGMVNDIIKQVRKMDPKRDRLPTFAYQDLSKSADDAFALKTFAQTLEKKLPGGKREIQVIGKGSKIFRDLFGEINDVRHSIFEGMNRLSIVARKNQLFDEILDADAVAKAKATAQTPLGAKGFFHSTPLAAKRAFGNEPEIVKMDDYVKEYFKDGVLVNRLSNTYTTREIAESFTNVSRIQDFMRGETGGPIGKTFSWAWRNLLLTPKAGAQYAKTILSVPTHIRNFLSSSAFSFANGTMFADPRVFKRAMDNAFGTVQVGGPRKPLSQEKYREYLELGIVNTNVRLGDLRNLMKDVRFGEGNFATDSILFPMINSLGKKTARGIKKAGKFMQDLYVAEDDIWKIINYEVQLVQRGDRYAKAGIKISPQALKQEVAQIVQDTVPNYAKVGEFVRAARVSPFGNFMSWPSEVFRTGFGIFKQIAKDLKDPVTGKLNPVTSTNPMKGLGIKRLVGMVGAMGIIPYGLTKGSQAIFGVSNEEADAANDFVAPWAKSSQKIFTKDPETNEIYYIDWSKNNVYDTLTRPFQSVLRNIQEGIQDEEILLRGFVQGIAEAAGETASPFISESIYTEAFMDIWFREGRTREGKQLYNEQTPGPEKIAIIMQHLGKTLLPTTQPFQRTKKAFTGEPGKGSELYEIPYELAGIFGFRLIKVNPEKSMAFKLFEYQKAISDSRKLFTGEIDVTEMRTANDVINRYYIANKKIFENRKKLLNTIENAEIVGLPPFKEDYKKYLRKMPEKVTCQTYSLRQNQHLELWRL
jgi:3-methyladenine DNA glycosylase Tag